MDRMNGHSNGHEFADVNGEQLERSENQEAQVHPLARITQGMDEATRRAFELFQIQRDAMRGRVAIR